jgi:hypothetical protein
MTLAVASAKKAPMPTTAARRLRGSVTRTYRPAGERTARNGTVKRKYRRLSPKTPIQTAFQSIQRRLREEEVEVGAMSPADQLGGQKVKALVIRER